MEVQFPTNLPKLMDRDLHLSDTSEMVFGRDPSDVLFFFGCFEKGFCCCTLSSTLTGNGKCIHHFFGYLRGKIDKNGDFPASNVSLPEGMFFQISENSFWIHNYVPCKFGNSSWEKISEKNYFGPIWILRSILREKKKQLDVKTGSNWHTASCNPASFFQKLILNEKSTSIFRRFHSSTISVQIRFSVFHFVPHGSLGVRICIEKNWAKQTSCRFSGGKSLQIFNKKRSPVTILHPG